MQWFESMKRFVYSEFSADALREIPNWLFIPALLIGVSYWSTVWLVLEIDEFLNQE